MIFRQFDSVTFTDQKCLQVNMTDHELLHPDAVPVHKQHIEADEDLDYICPGEPPLRNRFKSEMREEGCFSIS